MKNSYIKLTYTITLFMCIIPTTEEKITTKPLLVANSTTPLADKNTTTLLVANSTTPSSADKNTRDDDRLLFVTRPDLNELCAMLNISRDMCSCNKTRDLCGFEAFLEKVKNESDSPPTYRRSSNYTLTYVIVTIMASFFGLVGNALVLLVALTRRRSLTSCKLHIARLAFISFIVSVVQIVNAVPLLTTNAWQHSATSCKVIRTVLESGSLLIIGLTVIIAVERFMLVNRGIESGCRSNSIKHAMFLFCVCFVTITVIPYVYGLNIESNSGRCVQFQGDRSNLSLPYNWFVLMFHSVAPLSIISVLYIKIIKYITKHTTSIDNQNNYLLHANKVKTNKRCKHVLGTILLFFLVCAFPVRVINIYMDMEYSPLIEGYWSMNMDAYLALVFVGYVTYPFQITINPVLYSMIDTEWRKDVREIMRKLSHSI